MAPVFCVFRVCSRTIRVFQFQVKCPQTEQTEQTEQTVPSWAAAHMNMQQGAAGAGAGVPSCPHLPLIMLIINTLHSCVPNCSAAGPMARHLLPW